MIGNTSKKKILTLYLLFNVVFFLLFKDPGGEMLVEIQ